jgi:hypothetical protein
MKATCLLAAACLLWAGHTHAQSTGDCPALPADSGLAWEKLDGGEFVFCKAMRASDGGQAFAVTISEDSPFKPRRSDRLDETVIDGHQTHWYSSEVAGNPGLLVRETLVELDDDQVAHIALRAVSEEELDRSMDLVERLQFADARLSSN